MPASPEPPLPPGYYLDNFEFVLKDVAARYRDLLQPGEAERLAAFLDLPLPARRLLVRLWAMLRDGTDWRETPATIAVN